MDLPDRYTVIEPPMEGGMATVFKCRDSILERDVALKVMPKGGEAKRLNDELTALYKIRSKHVVQVFDVCIDNTSIGIIQEYIDGNDLFCPAMKPTNCENYLRILWQLSSGIADIHEANLIHRDIKPNNMKIDPEGILKIFDFGLARGDGPEAATMGFVGTHGFSAPEQYKNNVQFTKDIDTFAFGATMLYYALQSQSDELAQKPPVQFPSNPFKNLPFKIPDEVANVLFNCLSIDPSKRPQMREVNVTIERHLLFNMHRALVILDGKPSYLDSEKDNVSLKYGKIAGVDITYDGFEFKISNVSGDVFVNNAMVGNGYALPGACVLTLGGPELKRNRAYVTFDLSNPEIVA